MKYVEEVLYLAKILDKLKRIKRTGWLKSKIHYAESVSEHLHHTILMTILLKKYIDIDIDWERVYILAAMHDIAEAYTGDIPHPVKTEEDKNREMEYLSDIFKVFGVEYLLSEVEDGDTMEHYIYKFGELLATFSQGIIYLEKGYRDPYIFEILSNTIDRMEKIAIKTGISQLRDLVTSMKKYYGNIV